MRINKLVAYASGLSRRKVDELIRNGRILVNGQEVRIGQNIQHSDQVTLNGNLIKLEQSRTIMLNKPRGYVVSRRGQGSETVYNLLPRELSSLKPIGRLDKNSSGLLLLTNDGDLANKLTHPSFKKEKIYSIKTDRTLSQKDIDTINSGVELSDGISHMSISKLDNNEYKIVMYEGRNRQIRRTLNHLGYDVTKLHRVKFANYSITDLQLGEYKEIRDKK